MDLSTTLISAEMLHSSYKESGNILATIVDKEKQQ